LMCTYFIGADSQELQHLHTFDPNTPLIIDSTRAENSTLHF